MHGKNIDSNKRIINYKMIQMHLEKSRLFMKIYENYNNIVLMIGSFYFGIQLLMTPTIVKNFQNNGAFGHIMRHFSKEADIFGVLLVMLTIVKLIAVALRCKRINIFTNIAFFAIYSMIFFSFLFATPPNIITTLSLVMTLLSFGMILKERN